MIDIVNNNSTKVYRYGDVKPPLGIACYVRLTSDEKSTQNITVLRLVRKRFPNGTFGIVWMNPKGVSYGTPNPNDRWFPLEEENFEMEKIMNSSGNTANRLDLIKKVRNKPEE